MILKNLLAKFTTPPAPAEYFFAVELSDDQVKSAVWQVVNGQTQVVQLGATLTWDGQDQDKLLRAVDQSLTVASKNLDPEPNGAVFGLPEAWLDKEEIVPDKKAYLKTICQQLELKPLGFVVTHTALVQYLKSEEGTPLNAILIQLSSTEITVSLVKLGKVIGTQLVGRSGDLGQDAEEGLSRFEGVDSLPARMILYDGRGDFEEDKQQLISYEWEEKLPFTHFPKVEVLPVEASIKAIALAGGSEVAKSLGFKIKPQAKPKVQSPDLGFVADKDLALEEPAAVPETATPTVSPSPSRLKPLLQLIKQKTNPLLGLLKSLPLPQLSRTPKTFTLLGLGFAGLLLIVFLTYWYLPKAKITLYFEPKTLATDFTITIDPEAATLDSAAAVLPGESLSVSVAGQKSAPTSGKKLVGDPASGSVILYNKTSQLKTLPEATVLIGPNNLAFSLDEETAVASRSATDEGYAFGKATAKITAQSIGEEGNLSAGSSLSLQKFSDDDFSAKVDQGLTGGSSQEVKAVAAKDQNELIKTLTVDLISKAQQELQARLTEGKTLVDVADRENLIAKKFSHDLDEASDSLSLEAKLEYTALSYSQADLNFLTQEAIKEKIPENFVVSETSQTELNPAQLKDDGTATVAVSFQAQLIPKLDFNELKQNLKGRYPHLIQDYLSSLPGFVRADMVIKPNLPKALKTLPRVSKNITIEIRSQ